MSEIPFNLNEYVKVKLTDYGIAIMKERRDQLNKYIITRGGVGFEHDIVRKDKDGYTEFQMWNLMEIFGGYIGLCKEQPFHLDIKVLARE